MRNKKRAKSSCISCIPSSSIVNREYVTFFLCNTLDVNPVVVTLVAFVTVVVGWLFDEAEAPNYS